MTTTDAEKFITGQGILAALSLGSGVESVQVELNSHRWSLDNDFWYPFKRFDQGATGGRIDLTDYDQRQATYEFFTNGKGLGRVVADFRVILPPGARMEGGLPAFQAKSRSCESVRPTQKVTKAIVNGFVDFFRSDIVFASSMRGDEGQTWRDVDFEIPGGFEQKGSGAFCKLISATRYLKARTSVVPYSVTYVKARNGGQVTQGM